MQELALEKLHILEKLNLTDSCSQQHLFLLILEQAFRKNPYLINQYATILNTDFTIPTSEVSTYITNEFRNTRLSKDFIRKHLNNSFKNKKQRLNRLKYLLKGDAEQANSIKEVMQIID